MGLLILLCYLTAVIVPLVALSWLIVTVWDYITRKPEEEDGREHDQ